MEKSNLSEFPGGWIVGNFYPALYNTPHLEICVKTFRKGEGEPTHFQKTASELTLVISGECRMGDVQLKAGEIIVIPPRIDSDFTAITDCIVLGVKWPSTSDDKVLGTVG